MTHPSKVYDLAAAIFCFASCMCIDSGSVYNLHSEKYHIHTLDKIRNGSIWPVRRQMESSKI